MNYEDLAKTPRPGTQAQHREGMVAREAYSSKPPSFGLTGFMGGFRIDRRLLGLQIELNKS